MAKQSHGKEERPISGQGRYDYVLKASVYSKEFRDKVKERMEKQGLGYKEDSYGLFFIDLDYWKIHDIVEEIENDQA